MKKTDVIRFEAAKGRSTKREKLIDSFTEKARQAKLFNIADSAQFRRDVPPEADFSFRLNQWPYCLA